MKKKLLVLPTLFLILAFLLQGCSGTIDRTGFMSPVKIQIPNGVKNDTATVSFVKSSEKLINALSDRVENIARNGKDLIGKQEEDMTMMEKIKMTKLSVQFFAAGGSLAKELVSVQNYIENKQKQGVNETDMKAYKTVEKALENRINQLNNKYKNLFK